jgi:hypothetical protein
MTVKDEIQDLVNSLDDQRARDVLAYLRRFVQGNDTSGEVSSDRESREVGSHLVPAKTFLSEGRVNLATLAAQQGIGPIRTVDDLAADFWPEDDSVDEFIVTLRQWRREGGDG